ncbi:hypothetical protein LXL04_030243 [Taraxacum kok-saghyz]
MKNKTANKKHISDNIKWWIMTLRKPGTKREIVANLCCAQEVLRMTYCELASYELRDNSLSSYLLGIELGILKPKKMKLKDEIDEVISKKILVLQRTMKENRQSEKDYDMEPYGQTQKTQRYLEALENAREVFNVATIPIAHEDDIIGIEKVNRKPVDIVRSQSQPN